MTEKEIAEKLEFVRFNMVCEGFELTEKDIETGRDILSGKITGDEAVKRIIKENKYELDDNDLEAVLNLYSKHQERNS